MHRSRWLWAGLVALVTAACGGTDSTSPSNGSSGSGGSGTSSTGEGGTTTSTSTTTTSTTSGGNGGEGGGTTTSTGTGGTGTGGAGAGGSGTGGTGTGGSGTGGSGTGGAGAGGSGGSGGAGPCQSAAECDDGNFCNGAEACDNGACVAAPSGADCSDGIACTVDLCDPIADACTHTASDAACDDALFCTGVELCDPANGDPVTGCVAGDPTLCDDGVACTVDSCDEAGDACLHPADNSLCNTSFCAGSETCNPLFGCTSGGVPSCDDGVSCTSDFCDQGADACAHVPQDALCDDGAFCTGVESCDPANGAPQTGCVPGTPIDCSDNIACTTDSCNEATDACVHAPVNAACNDNVFCNGAEVCNPQVGCQAGSPITCDDGLSCTSDSCSNVAQSCVFAPVNAACDDGLYCNGQETCNPNGQGPSGCQAGVAVTCASDGISCTTDACDEANDSCAHTPDNAQCPPGQFCVVQQNGCTSGQPCSTNAQCADGDLCNGVEQCIAGICQPGQAVNCNDLVGCTVDSCNPATGQCGHAPNDLACDDGFGCNGVETCNAQLGCVSGVAVNCDDGVACTFDSCTEPNGTCAHFAQSFLCDDGVLCNGAETCDPQAGCQPPAAPYVCPDDGIACTTQVCNPVLDACQSIPHDNLCGCGQTCSVQNGGCGSFCTVKTCQGKVYACGDCLDNDGDCKIDASDTQCLGPCDNTEDSFYGGIPGQNNSPCKSDCYFDQDTGSGNDDCYWSHKCDPLEVPPNYPPEGSQCEYNPNANIPGYNGSCNTAFQTQSATCLGYCGPLTPNGCDCFGCCAIPGAPTTVWLGSENPPGTGSCNLANLADPTKCKPCTQVAACLNTCDTCEICVGQPDLPPGCFEQQCPAGVQKCGLPGQSPCPATATCITGCCQANPE